MKCDYCDKIKTDTRTITDPFHKVNGRNRKVDLCMRCEATLNRLADETLDLRK